MEKYTFADFEAGKTPPKGWDCADAVADGWGKAELDAYMRATVMPLDEWQTYYQAEWAPKEKPAASKPAGPSPTVQQMKPAEQAVPQSATITDLRTRRTVKANDNWQLDLVCNAEGKIKPSVTKNWALFLEHHADMQDVLGYDVFAGRVVLLNPPPWVKSDDWTPRALSDVDISRIIEWLEGHHLTPKFSNVAPVIERVARVQSFHPVRDYLDALPEWDGVSRLNAWLETYAGVEDTPLTQAFARKVLCAAVRRVRQPGCKFDHVLVLNGAENLGKSRLIRALCPEGHWFGDQLRIGSDAKTVIEQSAGKWLIEMAEMIGAGRREVETVKHFVTTQSDRARKAYARTETEVQRQFILFGTSNERRFLTSLTGNRRFWVVDAGKADVDALVKARDQLWAEACAVEPEEKLYLEGDLYEMNNAANADKIDYGAWSDLLDGLIPQGLLKIAVRDAWKLVGIEDDSLHRITDLQRRTMQKALAGLGFEPETRVLRRKGDRVKAYVRGDPQFAKWWPYQMGDEQPPQESLTPDW
jgi:predicted P-loop ATPase